MDARLEVVSLKSGLLDPFCLDGSCHPARKGHKRTKGLQPNSDGLQPALLLTDPISVLHLAQGLLLAFQASRRTSFPCPRHKFSQA